MQHVAMLAYVALCALIAYAGRNTKIGVWGWGMIAFLFSPLVAFLILLLVGLEKKHTAEK